MKRKSTIAIRAKLWTGTSLTTIFGCILSVACGPRHDRLEFQETQAINALKVIYTAEIQYQTTYPEIGFSCSLQGLGGDPGQGPPTPTSARLLIDPLPNGSKSGYIFNIANCTKSRVNGVDVITDYTLTAVPQKIGATGHRGFCMDQSNELKIDSSGGTNCTESLH